MRIEETSGKHRTLRVDFVSLARGYLFVHTLFSHQRLALLDTSIPRLGRHSMIDETRHIPHQEVFLGSSYEGSHGNFQTMICVLGLKRRKQNLEHKNSTLQLLG
jgi:hypothetical protein